MSYSNTITGGFRHYFSQSSTWKGIGWIALVIFVAALFGIYTRPLGFLATLWPANALLSGIMVRSPRLAFPTALIGAIVGFLAADLMTGNDLVLTLWLTLANLGSSYTSFWVFRKLSHNDLGLKQPLSILYLFLACFMAGLVAATIACYAGPLYFNKDIETSFIFWVTTEFVNCILLLPVLVSAPSAKRILGHLHRNRSFEWSKLLPAVTLLFRWSQPCMWMSLRRLHFPYQLCSGVH